MWDPKDIEGKSLELDCTMSSLLCSRVVDIALVSKPFYLGSKSTEAEPWVWTLKPGQLQPSPVSVSSLTARSL